MERFLMNDLKAWKQKKNRKPLLLSGARQVGKTWLMKEFGQTSFEQMVYINFDRDARLHDLFARTLDPKMIISAISAVYAVEIVPESTLIIFDEVQEEPRALAALKYFCEEAPEYAIIAAGSFMGIALRKGTTFPVGKLERMELYPLSFREFLHATESKGMSRILEEGDPVAICAMKSFLIGALRNYYAVGGMPEVVQEFIDSTDLLKCRKKQEDLLDFYRQDFAKHAEPALIPRLYQVWDSIPGQLAKENRKFTYGRIEKGARAKDFEIALQWLKDCGLIHMVHRVKKPGLPLKAYEEMSAFKIYVHDVGILGAMGNLPPEVMIDGNRLFTEFKGALTEQYVSQQLVADLGIVPAYYSADNSRGEVDFLIQRGSTVVPIEVKAEENLKAKSLKAFVDKFQVGKGVRISMSDYREQDWLVNIPLYAFTKLI
ncbi:MAG: ATP-binding protein [Lachnospiraceae bacterium]|nr:ATP-binding protein [Lachnospiraceae bacterium]